MPRRGPVSDDGMAIRGDTHWRLRCATGRFAVDQGISCTLAALRVSLSSSPVIGRRTDRPCSADYDAPTTASPHRFGCLVGSARGEP
jgi:hypothetical protein